MAKPLTPLGSIPKPNPANTNQGWGTRIEVMLIRAVLDVINVVQSPFTSIISWGFRNFLEDFENEAITIARPLLEPISNNPDVPKEFRDAIKEGLSGNHPAAILLVAGALIGLMTGGLGQVLSPLWQPATQAINKTIRPSIFDPNTASRLWYRYPELRNKAIEHMARNGITDADSASYLELNRPRIPAGELARLALRHPQQAPVYYSEIGWQGYSATDIETAKRSILLYPGPSDLISFAVRDVFNENIVQKYSYDEDYPATFSDEMKKAGYADGYANLYWRAHWNLPSVLQVMDIFHRTNFSGDPDRLTESDVLEYLRINDIPSFWRKRLLRTTYDLITRVDARRMYEVGTWNEDQLYTHYLKLGYEPQAAKDLVDWQKKDRQPTNKDITQALILKAYKNGQFDRSRARQELIDQGYDSEEADFVINTTDYDIQQSLQDEEISRVETLYINNLITDVQAQGELGPLNLPATQIRTLFQLWDIRKKKAIKLPTQGELEEFYLNSIINREEYEAVLIQLNFSEERRKWTLVRADQKVETAAVKKQEETLKEQQRLETDIRATQYAKDRAGIDVQIAQANLQIADIKLALYGIDDPDIIETGKVEILQLQDDIKTYMLDKAELRVSLTSK